ncbi:MAG: metallophosphoesterase [Proteobacteria bacterium]|nr:metallophosphoesterase [Pseudomonadota bacterium]
MSNRGKLVQPLFDGPVDLIGDVHGEIDALRDILQHLGYDDVGRHPEGRRLVFLGDLVDRGPDSPGVVRLVMQFVEAGCAQCVMGNHELNIMRARHGELDKLKPDNAWFFGACDLAHEEKAAFDRFFASLPVALHREDLRAVHACWEPGMIATAAEHDHALALYKEYARRIDQAILIEPELRSDTIERSLAKQNRNPIKVLTSGLEIRTDEPWGLGDGKLRHEDRDPWFERYNDDAFVVFGHYWRIPAPGCGSAKDLFGEYELHHSFGNGNAMCIDYSVGRRYLLDKHPDWPHRLRLGALRWPERELVFDDGERREIASQFAGQTKER